MVFARDTRESGPRLVAALQAALEATGTEHHDYGLLTTPQLHYITRCKNTLGSPYDYGTPTELGYYEKTAAAFRRAMGSRRPNGGVIVDCANGVGGPKLRELIKHLPPVGEGGLDIKVVNDNVQHPEKLNHQVISGNMVEHCTTPSYQTCSAEQTMSKPASEPHLHLKPRRLPDVLHLTGTPIALSTTLSTKTRHFVCSMATG